MHKSQMGHGISYSIALSLLKKKINRISLDDIYGIYKHYLRNFKNCLGNITQFILKIKYSLKYSNKGASKLIYGKVNYGKSDIIIEILWTNEKDRNIFCYY